MMIVKDLIELARDTAKRGSPRGPSAGRPKTVYLNRAVSTAYQAIFLTVCKCAADIFVGAKPKSSNDTGWVQVYRAVEHRKARRVCDNKKFMIRFSKGVRDFGEIFVVGLEMRYRSDYDPFGRYSLEEVLSFIDEAEKCIDGFLAAKKSERRLFVTQILINNRNT